MTQQITTDIIIIGAGLTGLSLAYYLKKSGQKVTILEARDRVGGRIYSKKEKGGASVEIGATWLGEKHVHLNGLLQELGIGIFEQTLGKTAIYEPISTSPPQLVTLPPNDQPSFRIQGGSSALIQTLVNQIPDTPIHLNQAVKSIEKVDGLVQIKTEELNIQSEIVVSTLPPYLLTQSIDIQPVLPNELTMISKQTHTWMGESIKVGFTFKEPFWRGGNLSGTIFSNVGPVSEMYDHTNYEETGYALKGFMNGSYFSLTKAERRDMILNQLRKYFGNKVDDYLTYEEGVWRKEPFTFAPYPAHVLPHQNNGNPIYRKALWDGQFFIAGSETASQHPGYMDGAVLSAQYVAKEILKGIV